MHVRTAITRAYTHGTKAVLLTCVLLLSPILFTSTRSGQAAEYPPCNKGNFSGGSYTACVVDLHANQVNLHWLDQRGKPYEHLKPLAETLAGQHFVMAMNAGIFDVGPNHQPLGIYIENGRKFRPLNTSHGSGNFYVEPNGVFYTIGDKAVVVTTREYQRIDPKPDSATQSGPMLVIKGTVNSEFVPNSQNEAIRSGVGVRADGAVVLMITNTPVNFYTFASLFRDQLKCPDALYLDGAIARMYAPSAGQLADDSTLGPMIAVTARERH